MKRHKTQYPGLYYRVARRAGGLGKERIYYAVIKRQGRTVEVKLGRQYQDNLTPAKANRKRLAIIEGRELTPKEKREAAQAAAEKEAQKWTIGRLWDYYCRTNPDNKALRFEKGKFERYLRGAFGDKEPCELASLDVDRLRLGLLREGKRTTAARVLELLRRTINFGVKRGLVEPLRFKIQLPPLNNEKTEFLASEELRRLLEALDHEKDQTAASIVRLALSTGMRRSEIFKLRWSDIDFVRGYILLRNPKRGKDARIPLNEPARRVLESIPRCGGNWVFPGRKPGSHLTDCRAAFRRIKKTAGLPDDFRILHGCRHHYASTLASNGVSLHVIQRLLTHRTAAMTQRYSHLSDEALRKASELAGELVEEAVEGKAGERL